MSVAKEKRRKGPLANIIELVVTIAAAVGLALLIQAFVAKPYRIPSGSMIPTLQIGQRIIVNRLDTSPGLGAVTVFHPPAGADGTVEQCMNPAQGPGHAAPCDKSTPAQSPQTYVKRVVGLPGDHLMIRNGYVWRNGVKETGRYINLSYCSSAPGNECSFSASITVPSGDYYMMGDNRGDSDDSRFWGPVPEKNIIGVAIITYWPLDRIGFF
jgi:signal peptidase I